MIRDAIAILAHLFVRYGRAEEAVALLGAVAELDADPAWAQRARCIALLRAGRPAEAAAEAERLLDGRLDDPERVPLLHALARACWALGRAEEARAAHLAACNLAVVSLSRSAAEKRRR